MMINYDELIQKYKRLGITDLAFNTISLEKDETTGVHTLVTAGPITSLDDVWAAVQQ